MKTTIEYPRRGPSIKITSMTLSEAYDLVRDDSLSAMSRVGITADPNIVVCKDEDHLVEVEAELSERGVEWDRISNGRVVGGPSGDIWVSDGE